MKTLDRHLLEQKEDFMIQYVLNKARGTNGNNCGAVEAEQAAVAWKKIKEIISDDSKDIEGE